MREHQDDRDSVLRPENLVWLTEERTFGYVVGAEGAHVTLIRFGSNENEWVTMWVENDEWKYLNEIELGDTNEYEYDDE